MLATIDGLAEQKAKRRHPETLLPRLGLSDGQMQEAQMRALIALLAMLAAMPVQAADRDGPRQREREAAYQMIERHPVTERYRYYVPTSAFTQRRGDEPRVHAKWRPRPNTPSITPAW